MSWKFKNDIPIYLQIMEEIKLRIAQGMLRPGDKVPAVRELALEAGVNPNTMQKALSELEREGVLCSQRTSGRYVADINDKETGIKQELSIKYVEDYVRNMKNLGFDDEKIIEIVKKYLEEQI